MSERIENWLIKLAAHFSMELGEEQISVFTHALRLNTPYQIDEAFERCLNECMFMPKLAEVHAKMPETRYPPENPGAFVLNGPPTLELVRPVAEEICKSMTGREYHELDTINDRQKIHDVFAAANRERYKREAAKA